MLSDKQLTIFIEIYRKRFGRDISRDEARDTAMKFIRLMKAIHQPMSLRDYREVQKSRQKTKQKKL